MKDINSLLIVATRVLNSGKKEGDHYDGGTWMDEHAIYADLLNQSIPVPMPEGGILLFDGLLFHAPGKNTTEDTRMVAAMGYHSVDEVHPSSHTTTIRRNNNT